MTNRKTIDAKFEEPSIDNVGVGDFLVVSLEYHSSLDIFPITGVGDEGVFYEPGLSVKKSSFSNSIILRRDGRYLVGEKYHQKIIMKTIPRKRNI